MYLEERRQLEKALYFKAVGISKQACYRCFLRDRLIYHMVVLVCQEKKMDTAVILLCASQCKAKCSVLRHRWEPESSKESSISFLSVEKEEKKLLAKQRLALKDFRLVG